MDTLLRKPQCGIYHILNTVNGKRYIGSSAAMGHRWREHKSRLRNNKHSSIKLQASWAKYGESSFKFEVIVVCLECELKKLEQEHIDKYLKLKISLNCNNRVDRVNFTPEVRAKLSKANKGRLWDPETKAARVAAANASPRVLEYRNGKLKFQAALNAEKFRKQEA